MGEKGYCVEASGEGAHVSSTAESPQGRSNKGARDSRLPARRCRPRSVRPHTACRPEDTWHEGAGSAVAPGRLQRAREGAARSRAGLARQEELTGPRNVPSRWKGDSSVARRFTWSQQRASKGVAGGHGRGRTDGWRGRATEGNRGQDGGQLAARIEAFNSATKTQPTARTYSRS